MVCWAVRITLLATTAVLVTAEQYNSTHYSRIPFHSMCDAEQENSIQCSAVAAVIMCAAGRGLHRAFKITGASAGQKRTKKGGCRREHKTRRGGRTRRRGQEGQQQQHCRSPMAFALDTSIRAYSAWMSASLSLKARRDSESRSKQIRAKERRGAVRIRMAAQMCFKCLGAAAEQCVTCLLSCTSGTRT
jgi:hypothetical protein